MLVFVVIFFFCGDSKSLAQEKTVLPVTYSATNANMLSLWVAKDAGYFDEQGLDVRMLLIRGGSLAVQLLVTGQSPIGLIGGTSAAYAYLQGNKDVVVISRLQNVMAYTLGAKPEIQKPEDIKGKKLAVSRFGSTSDFVAEYALKASGIKEDRRDDDSNWARRRQAACHATRRYFSVGFLADHHTGSEESRHAHPARFGRTQSSLLAHGTWHDAELLGKESLRGGQFMRASMLAIKRIKNDRPFAEKVLAKYVRTSDQEAVKTALEHQIKILPDIPTPFEDGIKTILEDLARSTPRQRTSLRPHLSTHPWCARPPRAFRI